MLRVTYKFSGDLDLIEEYYSEPSRAWVQERAYTLGAGSYTPEVCDVDDPDMVRSDVPGVHVRGLRDGVV